MQKATGQSGIVAIAGCSVEVDQLDQREHGKTCDPIVKVVELQSLLFSLDELHDFSSHQVN